MAMENQTPQPVPEEGAASRVVFALTVTLFLVSTLMIFFLVRMLWDLPWGAGTRQITVCFCNGMLLSLPILIAFWTVLGTQTAMVRIPIALTTLIALLATLCGTLLTMPSSLPRGGAGEIFLLFGGIAVSITVVAQIPLWVLKTVNGIVVSRKSEGSTKTQFSIKHLLVTTTIFALAIPLIQWISSFGNNNLVNISNSSTLGFCGIFILVLGLIALLSFVIVFVPKLRTWGSILLALAICALPFAVAPSIQYVVGRFYTWNQLVDTGLNVMAFSFANALTLIVVVTMYYQLGYRLRRSQR